MITSPARGADRVVGVSGPPPRALAASTALIVLLLGALALRLTIAYILFPASGFESDITTYVSWALTMAREGPGGFYANAGFIDYPPGYLLVLWPIGVVAQALGGTDPSAIATPLVKLPAMLADIGVGWLLYRLVLGWAWPSRRAEGLALAAAALYVFNPVTWYDSALWGQTDSVGALVLLLGVAALVRGNSEGAALLGVLAALVKPQFGVVLVPLVGVMLLRRHLIRPGSGPRHDPWGPARLRGWLARVQGWPRLVTSGVVALVAFHVLALPFGMGIPDYLDLMGRTAAGYEYLTVNAYNPWALVGLDGNAALAWAMPYWQSDQAPLLLGVPAVAVGALLLVGGFLYGLGNALWRDRRVTIVIATIFLAMAFFVLPTRVHERYLMPVFALLPMLAVTSRRWLLLLAGLSVATLINLHAVLTYSDGTCATDPQCFQWGTPNVQDLALGDATRTPTFAVGAVLLVLAGFLYTGWRLWRGAAREQDDLALLSAEVEGSVVMSGATGALPVGAAGVGTAGPGAWSAPAAGTTAWDEPVRGPSALDWLLHRITPRPLRADRSATLAGEPPGRLGRLDLLVVLLVFASALTLRAFRVDQPYDMYFDEVYHARTAMEFLQDWRYDDPHDIYEWTHPHLAKYAMALGIELLGDHRVTGTSDLGVPVASAAIERRWSEDDDDPARLGDRLYVATGGDVRAYDLDARGLVATIPMAATAVALDADDHLLYGAGPDGTIWVVDTTSGSTPEVLASGGPLDPARVAVTDDVVVVLGADGDLASFDTDTGEELGSSSVPGAAGLETVPGTSLVVARPAEIADPAAVALDLSDHIATDPDVIEGRLRSDAEEVALAGWVDDATQAAIQGDIDAGLLPGVSISEGSVPVIAVSDGDGVSFRAATTLDELDRVDIEGGASGMDWGMASLPGGEWASVLYVAAGSTVQRIHMADDGPDQVGETDMPGPVTEPVWNDIADLLHVVGERDGSPTVYVLDSHGQSVFMDVPLPFQAAATVLDTQPDRPSVDRTQLLALAADGRVATIDVGGNAFGYRMPGVLMGALTAAGIYLLARVLFRRRSVGLFAAALAMAEGMLFVNSRIAMNDVYVTGFLVMAAALFAPVWLGTWRRWWQATLVVPLVGVLLGLALASKWVAAYAIGGFVLLVLLRSSLGRVVALLGMVFLTAVLGALAIHPSQGDDPHRNWPFLLVMVGLTLALSAAMVRRPVRLTRDELVTAVAWLVAGGTLLAAGSLAGGSSLPADGPVTGSRLLLGGGAMIVAGALFGLGAIVAGRVGRGPLAPPVDELPQPEPAGPGWLSPGRLLGVPWLLALGCLVAIPVVVYAISYMPWFALGNQLWKGVPAGHTGQTLWDLTIQMYNYHNNLRVPHAAQSPWWAWPLNLKPVWFYQDGFAGNTTGEIYDSGNLVVFWMGIPALLFGAVAAWRRRSLPLTLVLLLFLAMWLPWARIDRATFQYHYYTSVPLVVLALAYLLAELWHGPARLAWLIARVGAALCILGPSIMWLGRSVLCGAANVEGTDAGGQVCGASVRDVTLDQRSIMVLVVLVVAAVALLGALWRAYRAGPPPAGSGWLASPTTLVVAVVAAGAAALLAVVLLVDDAGSVTFQLTADELGALSLLVLLAPAWLVLRARDARRFALGVVAAAALFLLIWYPNLTGLPVPDGLATAFQGLLPTWTYDFQFAVNRELPEPGGMADLSTAVVAVATLLGVGVVMVAARIWHRRPEPLLLDEVS
ncbi:MAG: phospholipid carrier-dependent glycosyltransferase [Chloroflexota bacterium]